MSKTTLSLPARVRRCEELLFVWLFAYGIVRFRWVGQVEPTAVAKWTVDVAGPLMSKRERAAAADIVTMDVAAGTGRPETQMLVAATRWFCCLDLPGSEDELWGGPQLLTRRRDRPVATTLSGDERDAIYAIALDALSGIASGQGPAIAANDLRRVLADLESTGNGPVELEIENVVGARRVFRQLADLAEVSTASLDSETARKACRRIVAAIDIASELALMRV